MLCCIGAAAYAAPLESVSGPSLSSGIVKVLLAQDEGTVTISSDTAAVIADIAQFEPMDITVENRDGVYLYTFSAANGALFLDGEPIGEASCILPGTEGSGFTVMGNTFRGDMMVLASDDTVFVINRLDIDLYLRGVLPYEVIVSWPAEALKAQAIASRAYAYSRRRDNAHPLYDFDATTASQVYRGVGGEHPATDAAVAETAGLILAFNGTIIPAFFHSSCGGHTENSGNVWQQDFAYLQGKSSPYCRGTRQYQWEVLISHQEVRTLLGFEHDLKSARITQAYPSGRVQALEIHPKRGEARTLSGVELRRLLGANKLRSTLFTVSVLRDGLFITGQGWGHGVGKCQWCSYAMAKEGYDAKSILEHFYTGAQIMRKRVTIEWP